MPDPLKAVERLALQAWESKVKRDNAIREAVRSGLSLRVVADAAGLSHAAVARIVKR